MDKKEKIKLGLVYAFVFLIALFMDMKGGVLKESGIVVREEVSGDAVNVDLILNVEDVLQEHEVHLEVTPRLVTEEEAEAYFLKVMEIIDSDFSKIKDVVPIADAYEEGIVEAEWSFSPAGMISVPDGKILSKRIPEEGVTMTATVVLTCGNYEKVYRFPFRIEKPELTLKEQMELELADWIDVQQELEGETLFQLPTQLGGRAAKWREKKEFLSLKILLLEALSVILLIFARKKEKEDAEKKLRQQRELVYPEILNQLLILLEAGMTTRQAWHRMAYQYKEKQKKQLVEESEVYAAILQLDRRLSEGEKEKAAYENFAKQMDTMSYRRLVRLLVNNLEKGSRDICQQLSLEAKQAYDQRLLFAKKMGEEASTRMLIPMMLMMVLVMVIVMAPAIMGFSM